MGLKSTKDERHDGPSEDAITFWSPESISPRVGRHLDAIMVAHLHLPVRHIMSAVLHPAEDAVEIRW